MYDKKKDEKKKYHRLGGSNNKKKKKKGGLKKQGKMAGDVSPFPKSERFRKLLQIK